MLRNGTSSDRRSEPGPHSPVVGLNSILGHSSDVASVHRGVSSVGCHARRGLHIAFIHPASLLLSVADLATAQGFVRPVAGASVEASRAHFLRRCPATRKVLAYDRRCNRLRVPCWTFDRHDLRQDCHRRIRRRRDVWRSASFLRGDRSKAPACEILGAKTRWMSSRRHFLNRNSTRRLYCIP